MGQGVNQNEKDTWRAKVAWNMMLVDVLIGHAIGFDYPMDGDNRP